MKAETQRLKRHAKYVFLFLRRTAGVTWRGVVWSWGMDGCPQGKAASTGGGGGRRRAARETDGAGRVQSCSSCCSAEIELILHAHAHFLGALMLRKKRLRRRGPAAAGGGRLACSVPHHKQNRKPGRPGTAVASQPSTRVQLFLSVLEHVSFLWSVLFLDLT